ncbi:glucokinase [Aliiglaciecola lipolytica]|uniref:Glucokinase n=1 Tax=Aliiglaciecola lipolytica E3 TaxID=1127673 RepID=K6YTE6_9ALTE|nr:glucokinase [Aliiglaciecola lipolytica]GAC14565.1 glucokinase [Aliiglaciecola lipolytica E3]
MTAKFVADVGGTNIRICQVEGHKLVNIKKYLCVNFPTIEDAIKHYFSEMPDVEFSYGCIAIACPVIGDWVKMTNHTWEFSIEQLTAGLGLKWLGVINDFTSVAHSLPVLSDEQKVQIGPGTPKQNANIAVFGPGTGLGVEHLTFTEKGWKALDGEGGHVDFAPNDENEFAIWHYLKKKLGHVSAEEVLSGRGIVHIYEALAEKNQQAAIYADPAQITEKALSQECELCVETLQQFCKIMGSFAGNLALNLAAYGGVYIGGGIASRFVEFISNSKFRARFEDKGRFRHYVSNIPTFIITEPDHGLLGAAAYLQQNFKG